MNLQEFISKFAPISYEKAELIASYFREEEYSKNTFLIREGSVSKKTYFIQEGIVRCYLHNKDGDEITTRFFSAPDFLNDYLSFFSKKPSEENYQTLSKCKVLTIDSVSSDHCFHTIPEFREWGRMLLTQNFVKMQQQMVSMHKDSAMDRYLNFLKSNVEVACEVPLKYIASYLGITKHSLSRIRKELALSEMSR